MVSRSHWRGCCRDRRSHSCKRRCIRTASCRRSATHSSRPWRNWSRTTRSWRAYSTESRSRCSPTRSESSRSCKPTRTCPSCSSVGRDPCCTTFRSLRSSAHPTSCRGRERNNTFLRFRTRPCRCRWPRTCPRGCTCRRSCSRCRLCRSRTDASRGCNTAQGVCSPEVLCSPACIRSSPRRSCSADSCPSQASTRWGRRR